MKYQIMIIALFVLGLNSKTQSQFKIENDYLLKGKLLTKIDENIPQCGIASIATVVEFEIINFTDSSYSERIIPVIFACPNPNQSGLFEVGKTYEIVLNCNESDLSKWVFWESSKESLTKYKMKKKYWFTELKK
ncbi:hypothetical protein ACFS5M_12250 [Lacinutrix iliipiscaria]|uniref:Uncharacterized protein n=1 Tax=Lacinutrix iliipiscaria TaxID=1230532 RepID=A0ABW5WR66_9FLAO